MNIFVCVKQVPDTETKIVPNSDNSFVNLDNIKWIMNPYDEFAVEQALLVKQSNPSANITVVRVGSKQSSEALRTAVAMGADQGILVSTDENLDAFMTATALKGAIEKSGKTPDLIFCGKQAIDSDSLQVPQLLAQLLNLPSVSVVVNYEQSDSTLQLQREVDGGSLEVYEVNAPCLVACNKGLNTPRYASLPGIMKAKKKPLDEFSLSDVGVSGDSKKVEYSNFRLPAEKPAGKVFDASDEANQQDVVSNVINLLRTEAKVL